MRNMRKGPRSTPESEHLMDIWAVAVDILAHQKLVIEETRPCLDNPNVADVDRKNSLPDPPESEDDATGVA